MTHTKLQIERRKKKARRRRFAGNAIGFVIIIALAFGVSEMFKSHFFGSMPYIFGFRCYIERSGSMAPVIQKGSLVITQRVNPAAIREGDIITYNDGPDILTQRVAEIVNSAGSISFITSGDMNKGVNSKRIPADEVTGRFVYAVNAVGNAILAMRGSAMTVWLCATAACLIILTFGALKSGVKNHERRKKRRRRRSLRNDTEPIPEWRREFEKLQKTGTSSL